MATELTKATSMAWRKFLGSEAGITGMLYLRERLPMIRAGESHAMIHDGGRVEGYRQALDMMTEIIAAEPKKQDQFENV